jgi:pimeloyl-ACP methyl ester carboxylesterase
MADYEIHGSGKTLLLLHGALISKAMWEPQIAAFGEEFRVMTVDLPAHGQSLDVQGEYIIEKLSERDLQLLDKLEIHQMYLIGHSLGGMVAQQIAASHPVRIHKLVLAETAFGTRNST